jgi:two-component system, LuxR family, response regulator FixJ
VKKIVYVVDDDLLALDVIWSAFSNGGYHVEAYSDPAAFLTAAPHLPYGCIVLDLNMPVLDGLEVQEALLEMGNRFPVIFNSGRCWVPDAVKGMQAGAADFLQKGTYTEPLVRAVENALRTFPAP